MDDAPAAAHCPAVGGGEHGHGVEVGVGGACVAGPGDAVVFEDVAGRADDPYLVGRYHIYVVGGGRERRRLVGRPGGAVPVDEAVGGRVRVEHADCPAVGGADEIEAVE